MTAPLARVVHSIPGRARLRTSDLKGNADGLESLRAALEETAGVQNVAVNVRTGSVLVEHEGELDALIEDAQRRGVLQLDDGRPEPYLEHLHRALAESDRRLKSASNGRVDLETLSFVGFVAGGIYQCFNNHALPAGVTMLRYAVELVTATTIEQVRSALANLPQQTEQPPQA